MWGEWQLFYPFTLPGNSIQSFVKVLWMWLSPVSSPWTLAVTRHLHPPLLILPPRPPRSPPTLAPLQNWEHHFTWVLSLDCKRSDVLPSVSEPSLCLAPTPNLIIVSSTSQPSETTCLSGLSAQLQKQIDLSYAYSYSEDDYRLWVRTDTLVFKFHYQFLHQTDGFSLE